MNVVETELPGVLQIEPRVYADARGHFFEAFRAEVLAWHGYPEPFVQDNVSRSRKGVLRGLHVQQPHAQAKLVTALFGEVFDVAVDIRVGSPTFGRWVGVPLSEQNKRALFIPAGFAHGFLVMSAEAIVAYKCTEYYHPQSERSVRWDDPRIGIAWPLRTPVLSPKDAQAPGLDEIDPGVLPPYVKQERPGDVRGHPSSW